MNYPLDFGNDKSHILRGIAIILMVANHALPGQIIPFAVSTFSFLAGYGYAFARNRSLAHGVKRSWHLLSHFWIILFAVFVPLALFYSHFKFTPTQLLLNMFGLWGGLNYYCWYIYFYLVTMLLMPGISRIIDRFGLKAVAALLLVCAAGYAACNWQPEFAKIQVLEKIGRVCKLFPLVIAGYWIASTKAFARVKVPHNIWIAPGALLLAAGLYLLRGHHLYPMAYLDALLIPVIAVSIALIPDIINSQCIISNSKFSILNSKFSILNSPFSILKDLGAKSMHIWFLHALFFNGCSRGLFKWMLTPIAKSPVLKVLCILVASWILATATMWLVPRIIGLLNRGCALAMRRLAALMAPVMALIKPTLPRP